MNSKHYAANKSSLEFWFTQDFQALFLIPYSTVLIPGLDLICDSQKNTKLVSLNTLSQYRCSEDRVQEHLQSVWRVSLESSKQAWLNLYNFSQKAGQKLDFDMFSQQLKEGVLSSDPQTQEFFAAGQSFVESLTTATADSSDDLTESDQKSLFKRVFSQLPQLLEQFSDANLEAAAQDPDAWADRLYQQVFSEIDKKKAEQRKQALTSDIRTSIAERLREAGIKSSIDW